MAKSFVYIPGAKNKNGNRAPFKCLQHDPFEKELRKCAAVSHTSSEELFGVNEGEVKELLHTISLLKHTNLYIYLPSLNLQWAFICECFKSVESRYSEKRIVVKRESLVTGLKDKGYLPDDVAVIQDAEDEDKEGTLLIFMEGKIPQSTKARFAYLTSSGSLFKKCIEKKNALPFVPILDRCVHAEISKRSVIISLDQKIQDGIIDENVKYEKDVYFYSNSSEEECEKRAKRSPLPMPCDISEKMLVIFEGYIPVIYNCSVNYICNSQEKKHITKLIESEIDITESAPSINNNTKYYISTGEHAEKKIVWPCRIIVMDAKVKSVQKALYKKVLTRKIRKGGSGVHVELNVSSNEILERAKIIHELTSKPVILREDVLRRIEGIGEVESVESVSLYNNEQSYTRSQVDSDLGGGKIYRRGDDILIFLYGQYGALRIELEKNTLQGYGIVSVDENMVNLFLPLKHKPKVYIIYEDIDLRGILKEQKLCKDIIKAAEKAANMHWERGTINEVPGFTGQDILIKYKICTKGNSRTSLLNWLSSGVVYRKMKEGIRREKESFEEEFKRLAGKTIINKDHKMERVVIVSPLGIRCEYREENGSNRIIRSFERDKFIRVEFQDDNDESWDGRDEMRLFRERIRNILLDGLRIGPRRYFFIGSSASQLRSSGAWFVAPYISSGRLIGADYIRSWIGDMGVIKNVSTQVARIGLAFTTTQDVGEDYSSEMVSDIEREGYCFSDGIGVLSEEAGRKICQRLKLDTVPSAFQVRYGGYKGVLAVHRDRKIDITWRPSMKKFDSKCSKLEIVAYSKLMDLWLNRQVIAILEGLGVPKQNFIALHDAHLLETLTSVKASLKSFTVPQKKTKAYSINPELLPLIGRFNPGILFWRRIQKEVVEESIEDIYMRGRIKVKEGRTAVGVLDELGVLEQNEIFLMYRTGFKPPSSHKQYGGYAVPIGRAILFKNPCIHPGDIRLVNCIDHPSLHYLRDVIVFSQRGSRPLFNMCSGSDLDGDTYSLSWDQRLIALTTFRPYHYAAPENLTKENVLMSDIANFVSSYLFSNGLPLIAYPHLAVSDSEGIFSKKALCLSDSFNRSIDVLKTGSSVSLSPSLLPSAIPDFMSHNPFYLPPSSIVNPSSLPLYYSEKALGCIFRRRPIIPSPLCECYHCLKTKLYSSDPRIIAVFSNYGLLCRSQGSKPDTTGSNPISEDYSFLISSLLDSSSPEAEARLFLKSDPQLISLLKRFKGLTSHYSPSEYIPFCNAPIQSLHLLSSHKSLPISQSYLPRGAFSNSLNPGIKISLLESKYLSSSDFTIFDPSEPAIYLSPSVYATYTSIKSILSKLSSPRVTEFVSNVFSILLAVSAFEDSSLGDLFSMLLSLLKQVSSSSTVTDLAGFLIRFAAAGTLSFDDRTSDCIFQVASLSLIDASVLYKAISLYNYLLQSPPNDHKQLIKIIRNSRPFSIYLRGFLDKHEILDFIRIPFTEKYSIKLKNTGTCSLGYYTDCIRNEIELFAEAFLRKQKGLSNESCSFYIIMSLGRFSISSAASIIYQPLSISELEDAILYNKVAFSFDYIESKSRIEAASTEVFLLHEDKLWAGSGGYTEDAGSIYIINNSDKDLHIQLQAVVAIEKNEKTIRAIPKNNQYIVDEAVTYLEEISTAPLSDNSLLEHTRKYAGHNGLLSLKSEKFRNIWKCPWNSYSDREFKKLYEILARCMEE